MKLILGETKVPEQDPSPAKLRRLVELINGETWLGLDVDVKGAIYEGLLEKNAEDVKGGAGQYFTPQAAHQGYLRGGPAQSGGDHWRTGLRHGRLLFGGS